MRDIPASLDDIYDVLVEIRDRLAPPAAIDAVAGDHWTDKYEAWIKFQVECLRTLAVGDTQPQINWLNNALDEFRRLSGKASR